MLELKRTLDPEPPMIRRLLLAVVATTVLVLPTEAQAQTWCMNPGGGICFNVTSFSFVPNYDATSNLSFPEFTLAGIWSGAVPAGATGLQWMFGTTVTTATRSYSPWAISAPGAVVPGTLTTLTASRPIPGVLVGATPSIANVDYIELLGLGPDGYPTGGSCSPGATNTNACLPPVQAPEPASAALVLAGLLGLGSVARRRRRDGDSIST